MLLFFPKYTIKSKAEISSAVKLLIPVKISLAIIAIFIAVGALASFIIIKKRKNI